MRDNDGDSFEQTADYIDWLKETLSDAASLGLTMNEAMALPIPSRFSSLDEVQTEFERSVVHLYLGLEDSLLPVMTVD